MAAVPVALVIGAGVASADPPAPATPAVASLEFDAAGCVVRNDRGGCVGSGVYRQISEGGTKGAAAGAAGGCVTGAIAAGAGCGPGALAGGTGGLIAGAVGSVIGGFF